ncbi:MAG: GFA family protein [Solirubrobacteraceae bacterium]
MPDSAVPPSPATPLQGGCLCGAVRYEITMPLSTARYCHCTHCQRRTGTASSANGLVARAGFRMLSGTELVRAYQPPTGVPKLFCSTCGSALFSGDPFSDEEVVVRMGTLDRDPGIRPQYRQFVDSAASWEPIPDDGLKRYPRSGSTQSAA